MKQGVEASNKNISKIVMFFKSLDENNNLQTKKSTLTDCVQEV
jgi:hypothetical protein